MGSVTCFLIEPTGQYRRSLRRFSLDRPVSPSCPYGYHNAGMFLDVVAQRGVEEDSPVSGDVWPHDDARWPVKCDSCDYGFDPADSWQLSHDLEYRRTDTGELLTLAKAPDGAMWFAPWYSDMPGVGSPIHDQERPGQPHLIVKTPGGHWNVDQKSRNGNGWTWTGTPPRVTASPSIGIYGKDGKTWKYHAFLTDGVLVEC